MGQATALTHVGRLEYLRGEYAAATDSQTHALELYAAVGSQWGQANALGNLGRLQHQRGEYAAATDTHTRALDLYTAIGNPDGQAETLNNMGDLALDHPEAGDPHTYFSRALTIAQHIGTTLHQAHALAGQARCLLHTANTTPAITLLRQTHSLYRNLGVPEATEIQTTLSTLDKHAGRSPDQPATAS